MNRIELKKALETSVGIGLQEFLVEHALELYKLSSVKDCENAEDQALEFKSSKKAFEMLKNILLEIISVKSFEETKRKEEDKLFSL